MDGKPGNSGSEQTTKLADIDALRANALATRLPLDIAGYAIALGIYQWEIEPLLAARDRAASDSDYKYKVPPDIASFDAEARAQELMALVAEAEATHGYNEYMKVGAMLVRKDCEGVKAHIATNESCSGNPGHPYELGNVRVACGDEGVPAVCRQIHDRLISMKDRYALMMNCNYSMTFEETKYSTEALAQWATAEEIEWFEATKAERDARRDEIYDQAYAAAGAAEDENLRRTQQYEQDRANYESEQSGIEQQSQIGSLDPSNQPPAEPELIDSVSVAIPQSPDTLVGTRELVTVTLENQCDKAVTYASKANGATRGTLEPGQSVAVELPRCTGFSMSFRTETSNKVLTSFDIKQSTELRLQSDCETLYFQRPQ